VPRLRKLVSYLGLFILGSLVGGLLMLWLSGSTAVGAVPATVVERLRGETPEARVRAYADAVLHGDEAAALNAWTLEAHEQPDGRGEALRARREAITRQLVGAGLVRDFRINHIEWWRTCCEPGVINDSRGAGGARVHVQFLDGDGVPHGYIFDIFHREGPYWGAAMGYPVRRWALYDVYPYDEEPLYWRLVYEPSVRWLAWPPEAVEAGP
jgi:hypothetical protein